MILAASWSVLFLSLIHGMVEMALRKPSAGPQPTGEVYVPKHENDVPF